MHNTTVIIIGIALFACALARTRHECQPAWAQRPKSWQTLIGVVAVIVALLIVINPELYALGIFGDAAFFDLLVLTISLQLQTVISRAWFMGAAWLANRLRKTSMHLSLEWCCLVVLVSTSVSAVQKIVHRILS